MVLFPVQGHGVTIDALDISCEQLTRDLFTIAKFLFRTKRYGNIQTAPPPLEGARLRRAPSNGGVKCKRV